MNLPIPSSKMTARRARSDVTSAFDVSAVLNLAFLHPGCPTDDKLKEMVVDAYRNSRLFIEDHQAGRMPWTQLAAIYGAPPVDASHLANMSSFGTFRNRSALLERAGVPALPRPGPANPRTSHSCNLPSCKINLPFLCADLLNDVLGGQKFAMKASSQLERALEDCGSIVSGMGLVAKCKCDDWPQCLCPKRHEARKILNASVPGGLCDDRSVIAPTNLRHGHANIDQTNTGPLTPCSITPLAHTSVHTQQHHSHPVHPQLHLHPFTHATTHIHPRTQSHNTSPTQTPTPTSLPRQHQPRSLDITHQHQQHTQQTHALTSLPHSTTHAQSFIQLPHLDQSPPSQGVRYLHCAFNDPKATNYTNPIHLIQSNPRPPPTNQAPASTTNHIHILFQPQDLSRTPHRSP